MPGLATIKLARLPLVMLAHFVFQLECKSRIVGGGIDGFFGQQFHFDAGQGVHH